MTSKRSIIQVKDLVWAYSVNHQVGDGGAQIGPYPTRRAARAAALELGRRVNVDRYGRPQ